MTRTVIGRNAAGLIVDIALEGDEGPVGGEGGAHPDLAAHQALGLAGAHTHPYAADDHTHAGGSHPDLATHDALGLATDAELTTHAATAHGLSSHAIDGAFHSGTEVLPTTGQKNALAGTSGTPGSGNPYVTTQDGRLSDARTPIAHSHLDADIPAGIARDSEVTAEIATHAATPHGGSLPAGLIVMWGGLVANIPSGWVLCDGQNGTPDLRSKFVKGAAAGADPGATGGSATHTHAGHSDHAALTHAGAAVADHASHTHTYTQVVNHVHVQNTNSAATGSLVGSTPDTSTNTSVASGYSTANPTGGVATGTTNGPGAALTHSVTQPDNHAAQSHSAHDTPNSEPPYYALCFIQKV